MPVIKYQVAYIANRGRQPLIPKEKELSGAGTSPRGVATSFPPLYAPIDKRPKSSAFHAGVRGSNPLGSTIKDRLFKIGHN